MLFYYKFLKNKSDDQRFWLNNYRSSLIKSWYGFAFETLCFQHIDQIKQKLGILGVYTNALSFICNKEPDRSINGSQIDLLLDRSDNIIDICEAKYSTDVYAIDLKTSNDIRNKIEDFTRLTQTKKTVNVILITTYGLKQNVYSSDINYVISIDDLFK